MEHLKQLIERQCDNMATGTQMREFLLNDDGSEPLLRELMRLNLEQFAKALLEQKVKRKKTKETDPRVNKLIDFYHDSFIAEHKEKPHINGGACGKMLKPLLAHKSQEELEGIIKEYIVCGIPFFKEAGYPFLLLPNYIQKRAVQKPKDSIPEWKKGPV